MEQTKAQHLQQDEQPVTEILNNWVVNNDLNSANQLRSIIYYHVKGIVKKQINNKAQNSSAQLVEQLPNTTSLLHEVLMNLTPPSEIFDNKEQFLLSLASFVRWMLLDDIKAKSALKRAEPEQRLTEILPLPEAPDTFLLFDRALTELEQLSPRCYQVALMHYFLGQDLGQLSASLQVEKSTLYNELATAKAYLRTHCQS